MERINLARYQNPDHAQAARVPSPVAGNVNVAVRAHDVAASQDVRQFASIIWIVAVWLIGTLVFELNVIGEEPKAPIPISEKTVAAHSLGGQSMLQRWAIRETEFAITHSGIAEFDRVQRDSELREQCDWIIQQETQHGVIEASKADVATADPEIEPAATQTVPTQRTYRTNPFATNDGQSIAKPETVAIAFTRKPQPNPTSPPEVELAFEESANVNSDEISETSTELAWKGFSEGTIPGIVELVVHSFHELMTPVHVEPLTNDQTVITAAEAAADSASSVTFVETDTQEVTLASESTESMEVVTVDVSPPTVDLQSPAVNEQSVAQDDSMEAVAIEAVATSERARESQVTQDQDAVKVHVASSIPAQIVRSRPQLLRVPEHSAMLPARQWKPPAQTVAPPKLGAEPTAITEQVDLPLTPSETRLAAKWPFERSQPVNPTSGVTLNVDSTDVRTVFEMLARGYQMNILVAPEVEGQVTANVVGLSPEQALHGIVKMCGLNMQQEEGIIYVYPADNIPADARQLRVFELDFVRAATLEPTIQGLLSPVGNAYPTTLDGSDNLQTQESIVVVDIPSVIAQVERYIMQADQAPRQVMIEAHILEVELTDDMTHGVNFAAILGGDLVVGSFGLADNIVSKANPVFFAQVDGSDVQALLTVLETTTDSKTLASPRVQVINGQNARIQVGQQLGFTVATVTQTSTIQDIQFLETGVVLSVTPTISRDGRILMEVKPEVSDGVINPDTLLPEEETREVETSVLLDNHQGVIIGGLIQEKDRTVIKKMPWLGDVQYVGKLFQRREAVRSRSEIIVALVPHIIERCVQDERSAIDYERAATPLLQGALHRTCRPWEARLPDVAGQDCHTEPTRINHILPDVKH